MSKWLFLFWFLFLRFVSLTAQQDSINVIQDYQPDISVVVIENHLNILNKAKDQSSIAQQLEANTSVQLKSNGPGFLITGLYRGQAARHMAILWDGINIQNTINGTYDLGLIPSHIFSQSVFHKNGLSSQIGNAALGSAIELKSSNHKEIEVGAISTSNSLASNYFYGESWLKLSMQMGRFNHAIGIQHLHQDHHYRYRNGQEFFRRKNNVFDSFDLDYNLKVQLNKNNFISLRFWFQDADRFIPNSIIASERFAKQKDVNQRFSIKYITTFNNKWTLLTQFNYMDEYTGYFQSGVDSRANTYVYQLKSNLNRKGLIDQNIGLQYRSDRVVANFFTQDFLRNTYSLYYNARANYNALDILLAARLESIGSDVQPPVISASMNYKLKDQFYIFFNTGYQYQYPGFNDLYWPQGGDPDLKREHAYQVSTTIDYNNTQLSLYFTDTRDKIIWSVTDGILSPENRDHTQAYGVEFTYKYDYRFNDNLSCSILPSYYLNYVTNISNNIQLDGKQLIYIPKHKSTMKIITKWYNFEWSLNGIYNSKRFENNDNSAFVDGYVVFDIFSSYTTHVSNNQLKLYLNINNIFDQDYELVSFYPLPLRYLEFGFQLKL